MVTGDVTALYTKMCITRTLNVLKRELARNLQRDRPDDEIMRLLTTIMTINNDFTFNQELYLQVFGTAMGKTFAPNLINNIRWVAKSDACALSWRGGSSSEAKYARAKPYNVKNGVQ